MTFVFRGVLAFSRGKSLFWVLNTGAEDERNARVAYDHRRFDRPQVLQKWGSSFA